MKRNETLLTEASTASTTTTTTTDEDDDDSAILGARPPSLIYRTSIGDVSFGSTWQRRRQTLSMFTCSLYFIIPTMMTCWMTCLACLYYGNQYLRATVACYLTFALFVDKSSSTGSRTPRFRQFKEWWSHACDYLPLLLVKTADLPSDQNQKYVLGYHPHGIISVGAFCSFATDSAKTLDLTLTKKTKETITGGGGSTRKPKRLSVTSNGKTMDSSITTTTNRNGSASESTKPKQRGFSSLFPGIDFRILTLKQNFVTPLLREYCLWMGACDASKETFRNVLSKPEASAVVVVVGGAAESLMVHEGCMDLILKRRRGFVREAILANAHLVPVLGFGESNLYHVFDVDETSFMAKFQRTVKQYTGVGVPLFQGRSMFLLNYGFMAKRTPVCVVVGKPIPPPPLKKDAASFHPVIDRKSDEALNEDGKLLKEWHAKYIAALEALEKEYKDAPWNIPGQHREMSMRIIK